MKCKEGIQGAKREDSSTSARRGGSHAQSLIVHKGHKEVVDSVGFRVGHGRMSKHTPLVFCVRSMRPTDTCANVLNTSPIVNIG